MSDETQPKPLGVLHHRLRSDTVENVWVWNYSTGDDEEPLQYHMDIGQAIKFRVAGVLFNTHTTDTKPRALDDFGNPVVVSGLDPAHDSAVHDVEVDEEGNVQVPSLTAAQASKLHSSTIQSLFSSLSRQAAKPTAPEEAVEHAAADAEVAAVDDTAPAAAPPATGKEPAGARAPAAAGAVASLGALGLVAHEPVMQVNASIAEDGLGLLAWWAPVAEGGELDEDEGSLAGAAQD